MSIKETLQDDLKTAMRQGDSFRRDTLRQLTAAVKQVEVDEQRSLNEDDIVGVLRREANQRQETIRDAETAGRPTLAEDARAELALIDSYLPQMLSKEELEPIVAGIIEDLGAKGTQEMGRVMGGVMSLVKGKADGRLVSQVVREQLSK
jgi:hypothetical protein